MTVSNTTNKIIYAGDGANTTFTFTFEVPASGSNDIAVYFTDASGNISLISPTLYTLVLNAPTASNPTGVGGTVTYPLVGSPIALGTLLTILRTLPETQPTSLSNQGALYPAVIEAAFDNAAMMIQQMNELLGRQITVAVSDSTPSMLPPAAQRANLAFMFDSAGNPIAAAPGGANSPVSSAMAPVVNAATIAAAVALLGLSGVAAEPTGVMKPWLGTSSATPPSGYVLAGGQAIPRTGANAALFALVGTTFGPGDGSTTFNVIDMRGRLPAGLDNINGIAASRLTAATIPSSGGPTTLGGNGGTETNTVTIGKMPAHTHVATDSGHTHLIGPTQNAVVTSGGNFVAAGAPSGSNATASSTANITNASTGGGNPLEIVQPTICVNWIIKL